MTFDQGRIEQTDYLSAQQEPLILPTASTRSSIITRSSSSWWQLFASTIRAVGNPVPFAIFYLVALTLAEVLTVMVNPQVGQAFYLLILFILMVHTAITWGLPIHRFLFSLAFVPLIRVISLSLPLDGIPLIFWFLIVSVPLFAATYVAMRTLGLRPADIALKGQGLLPQLAFGLTGLLFGYVEYLILQPDPLILIYTWERLLIAALILLVSTGLLEEMIFRGIMQRTSIEQLGRFFGVIYVAVIFAMLHIGYQSLPDIIFVLVIGLLFGVFVARTGSLLGVTLSHSLTNIVLFLVIPYWLASSK